MAHNEFHCEPEVMHHIQQVQDGCKDEMLEKQNVVGIGFGQKITNGQPTGEPAMVLLVTHKLEAEQLRENDLVPQQVDGVPTDVIEVGFPTIEPALNLEMDNDEIVSQNASTTLLADRIRPIKAGYSVSHFQVSAGTIGAMVYDIQQDGGQKGSNPSVGVGMPNKYYLLSNNHVIANNNNARIGDPILQPGTVDGGRDNRDRIATLSRFVPIEFSPTVPLNRQNNIIDAAIAETDLKDIDREIYWQGHVRGWKRKANVRVGDLIKKTGRTTGFTTGRVLSINATVDINYGGNRVARFNDQIILTNLSDGGDSGSLILDMDNVAIGLLFAGSPTITIANQIENVRNLLNVEIGEQIF